MQRKHTTLGVQHAARIVDAAGGVVALWHTAADKHDTHFLGYIAEHGQRRACFQRLG